MKNQQRYEKLVRLRKMRLQIAVNALSVQQTLVNDAEWRKYRAHAEMLELAAALNARDDENRQNLTGNTVSQATLERYRQEILAIDQQLAESADTHTQASTHLDQMRIDLSKRSADYLARKKSLEQLEAAFQQEMDAAALLRTEMEDEERDVFHTSSPNAWRT
ncbi:hypothetical protein [Phyllobacterium myrsinacearum]|uniref:Septal ring factor EnvC (AmiA/AmiB activator) n=1 Tax=Phyllobacterium myrsinacearum TaxID=28101 RepID=A0A839EL09_9HYPH|nr:hypothetical protein [Phyllobacterium myrsinacearum]MBA8879552.1 septal ring factor EnvC (AmiA/AmiB activator) [Phyllobacterium myrsinacearum]